MASPGGDGDGALLPLLAFPVLRLVGRLLRADAASVAAHYGSVSVGTYAVAYFASQQIEFEYSSGLSSGE